jgi:hypothetical protein
VSYLSKRILDSVLLLANKAHSFDIQLSEAYTVRGDYCTLKGMMDNAI